MDTVTRCPPSALKGASLDTEAPSTHLLKRDPQPQCDRCSGPSAGSHPQQAPAAVARSRKAGKGRRRGLTLLPTLSSSPPPPPRSTRNHPSKELPGVRTPCHPPGPQSGGAQVSLQRPPCIPDGPPAHGRHRRGARPRAVPPVSPPCVTQISRLSTRTPAAASGPSRTIRTTPLL